MNRNDLSLWFFEGGTVAIPKKLIGLSETLGLDYRDLGQITYILYCDCLVQKDDKFSMTAVRALKKKSLLSLEESGDAWQISFAPLFNLIEDKLGLKERPVEEVVEMDKAEKDGYSETIKKIEAELAIFLTVRQKMEIQEVVQQYLWDYDLVGQMFINHYKNSRRLYPFKFYSKMAFGNNVSDLESLEEFHERSNYLDYKIAEVKKRLGHRSNFSEIEKEAYLKWTNLWKFSHEMVLLAVEQTLSAKNPSFKYIDRILENWYKDSIETREDVLKNEEVFRATKETPKDKKKQINDNEIRDLNSFIE